MNYFVRHAAWPHFTLHISQSSFNRLCQDTKTRIMGACIWNDTLRRWEACKGEKEILALCKDLCLEERKETELS